MSLAFEHLSREGKLNKIREQLQLSSVSGYPIPAPWVVWLLEEYTALCGRLK